MGAERWILFSSKKQAELAKKYLEPVRESRVDEYSWADLGDDDDGWCWLRWTSPLKLEVGYSFGNNGNDVYALCVARELARRFKIRRIGADSVGWYQDKEWDLEGERTPQDRYGKWDNWIAWLRAWNWEWSFWIRMLELKEPDGDWLKELREQFSRVDQNVVTLFKELDSKGNPTGKDVDRDCWKLNLPNSKDQ